MSGDHEALRDLLAPVALGIASPEEVALVDAHVRECVVCQEEIAHLRESADLLGTAVAQVDPPVGLKESVMATVRAEAAAASGQRTLAPAASEGVQWFRRRRRWTPVAALAAVALALVAGNYALRDSAPKNNIVAIELAGSVDAPRITGRVVLDTAADTAMVTLDNLTPLPPDRAYQLWVLREGAAPVSAGLFDPNGPTSAQILATGVGGAQALAVTAQPRANVAVPEGPILVQAALRGA